MAFCTAMLSQASPATHFCPSPWRPRSPVQGIVRFRISCVDTAAKAASNTDDSGKSPKETQMTVSITGATGFIGRKLVQRLLEGDHEVRVLTRSKAKAQLVFPGKKLQISPKLLLLRNLSGRNVFKDHVLLSIWLGCP